MTIISSLFVFCDGSCEPINPGGVATYGWIALRGREEIASGSGFIQEGPGTTNNIAEYQSLIRAVAWLWKMSQKEKPVSFYMDSQLVVMQVTGKWQVKAPHLQQLCQQAQRGLAGLSQWSLTWIPRESNKQADALSRQAYLNHRRQHGAECLIV